MKNKEAFDLANLGLMDKAVVREQFQEWCQKNRRTPMNPLTVQDWWVEDWGEEE